MISINESIISELTEEEVEFSGQFLRHVFLEPNPDLLPFSDAHIKTIWVLLKAVPSKPMKASIVSGLTIDEQLKLIGLMDEGEKLLLFEYIDTLNLLKPLFKELPPKTQHHILEAMYQKDKQKYKQLKVLLANKVSMVGGILIKQERVLQKFLDQEKQALLDKLAQTETTPKEIQQYAEALKEKYELEDIEQLLKGIVQYFLKEKPPMVNVKTFSFYLKAFELLAPYLELFETLEKGSVPLIDLFLGNFKRFPSVEWTIKVLEQVPRSFLFIMVDRLKNHDKISQFERRQLYSKLFQDLESNLAKVPCVNIRYVLSQL